MDPRELTSAQLRVLSHPSRIALLRRLRTGGPATSRMLGREFGIDSGAASYHLRTLAAGGLILEDHERGTRRERWWRAADEVSQFDPAAHDDEDLSRQYVRAAALAQAEELHRAAMTAGTAERAWLEDTVFLDVALSLDPPSRARLKAELLAVIARYRRPEGGASSPSTVVQLQLYERR
ncbi:helix-turn-helix domain-containing protein [Microbacterium sp.]|uniref:winged helix-turn-helix domain-containing protein n=1 Tax=Microbacterium sp. TaxID=51671 RepID=UPI00333E1D5D